ncbi:hypothetical protein ACQCRI_24950, partial [Ralstonia pseudosolanacearum]|uniref:hypothetical protein n=1 Tax=Ralstonia pseudosolanacearum TaxID=1310165 RepID=UPI003CF5F007
LQRYRHVVARKRQHGLTTTLIYATTPSSGTRVHGPDAKAAVNKRITYKAKEGRPSHQQRYEARIR